MPALSLTDQQQDQEVEELRGVLDSLGQLSERVEAMIERRSSDARIPTSTLEVAAEAEATETAEILPDRPRDSIQPALELPAGSLDPDKTMTLVGRTLLVLGGAFLLRALTESATFPKIVGVSLGMVYALYWLSRINRPRELRASCAFHGATSAVIAYPLVWEALRTFEVFGPWSSAVALAIVSAASLFVARRRDFPEIAALHVVGVSATAILLSWYTGQAFPYSVVLLALATSMIWIEGSAAWTALGWSTAIVSDVVIFLVTDPPDQGLPEGWESLLALQLGLLLFFLGSYLTRFSRQSRSIRIFELLQTLLVVLVGFRGAVILVRRASSGWQWALAALCLLLAAVAYGMPTLPMVRSSRVKFFYTTSLGFGFAAVGTGLLFDEPAWGWAPIAVGVGWLAHYISRRTLSLHAALLIWAAAISSGVAWLGVVAFLAPYDTAWPTIGPLAVFVLAFNVLCVWIPVRGRLSWGPFAPLPKAMLILALVLGLGGMILKLSSPAFGTPEGVDPAALAAARTLVLSLAAVLLAVAQDRSRRLAAASWLVYPVLALGAVLLVENLRYGRPLTLFLAFAFYGGALLIVPRIVHRRKQDASE